MKSISKLSSVKAGAEGCVFRDICTSMHAHTRVRDIADLVVKRITDLIQAKGAKILTFNRARNETELNTAYGLSMRYLSKGPVAWEKVIEDLCQFGEVRIIKDVLGNSRVQYPREAWEEGIRMVVDALFTLKDHSVGILRIYFSEERDISDEELNYLVLISRKSACVIQKAALVDTQRSQYDQLAIHTEKLSALGRMAAGIAHEINNPLAGVLLYSSNLLKKAPKEGPIREGLEVIVSETMRCKAIIQELLEFSREKEPKKALANINEILEKAVHILANEFRLHHITVEKALSGELEDMFLDEDQIEQVFVNLLINAVEAIKGKGVISVRSRVDQGQQCAKVEIADTGCGIAQEHMSKLFEPFFSTKPRGTGLGLAVSYGIIRNHQGSIQVSSKPGEGTCFTIVLPLSQGAQSKGASGA